MNEKINEAFEKAYESVLNTGWTNLKNMAQQIWDMASTTTTSVIPPVAQVQRELEAWLPMDTAPKDGTLLRLLVTFDDHAIDDGAGPFPTVGQNFRDNTGEDIWQFVGWCWKHDHFTDGKGTPVGWLPMLSAPPAAGVPWVMGLLDTGDWRLTRIRPNEAMTDEFNRRHSWEVERQMPPYSRERGLRSWFGETPEQAFTEAINDLFPGRLSEFLLAAPTPPASEQQQAVVMPERATINVFNTRQSATAIGWNDCLAEFLRLNPHLLPAPPSQGESE